ncbi:MAG: hypothetical protein Q7U57_00340 [Methylovulum sp.]|nr:hypothetical protein [Methylovulum sp.]
MNKSTLLTLAVAGTLTAVNVNAATVDPSQIENNVMRRIVGEVQHNSMIDDIDVVQDWEQSWPQWSQCHNPNGC